MMNIETKIARSSPKVKLEICDYTHNADFPEHGCHRPAMHTITVLDKETQSPLQNDTNNNLVQSKSCDPLAKSDLSSRMDLKKMALSNSLHILDLSKPRRLDWKLPNVVYYGNLNLPSSTKISFRYPKLSAMEWENAAPRYPTMVQSLTFTNSGQLEIANIVPKLQSGGVLLVSNPKSSPEVMKFPMNLDPNVPAQVADLNALNVEPRTASPYIFVGGSKDTDNIQGLEYRKDFVSQQNARTSTMREINHHGVKEPGSILANLLNAPLRFRHQCPICFKRFTKRSELKVHWLVHKGKKPYACGWCRRIFRQFAHLPKHCLRQNDGN